MLDHPRMFSGLSGFLETKQVDGTSEVQAHSTSILHVHLITVSYHLPLH